VPQISPRWRKISYLHPNHQNPPTQCPRSAPDGGKLAISTQTTRELVLIQAHVPPSTYLSVFFFINLPYIKQKGHIVLHMFF
jgi:hypothetical protein